ncbi:MAG: hypothetical protein QOI20_3065 [Acidimicrobiaceae bacterium]|nr:hypothetical protein [Acidimicrobiaceae bacterium]
MPLRSVPLRSVDLSAAPLRSVPLRSVFLQDIPLGGLLLNKIDAAKRPNIIDCSAVDCATQTLAQAATANAIVTTASLGTLFDAVNANDLPGSLADLLQGFIDTSNYPWEDLPLAGLQPYADAREAARTVVYRATFATTGNGSAPATLVVDLPAGFRYVPGSSFNDVTYPDPVATGEHLVWTLNAPGGATTTFTFRAYAGFDLASAATSAIAVTMNGVTVSAQGQAPVQVVQDFEGGAVGCEFLCTGNNAPGTAPVLAPNTLLASHIASAGDIDYYRVPVPAKGTRLQVRLGNHSTDADFDVAMLNTATGAPLRSVPLRSVPLRSVPLADNGIDASAATSSLSPETLDDIPVGAAPLRSVSENRSTADEFIATVSDAEPTVPGNDGSVQQYYTLQVTAYNGGLSNSPYVLYVKEWAAPPAPTCSARTFANAGSGVAGAAPALPSGLNTLYLVNQKRMGDTFGATDTNTALNALRNSLSNRADLGITGVVYPVESSAAAAAAYSAWDAAPCSPESANAVFTSIASIVDTVRAQRPTLKNIVVVGGDDIIPFARVADYTQISNESDYSATALLKTGTNRGTPIAASMATQNILTDDPLADVDPIGWLDHTLYVPDLAVGRLVETPADVVAQVNQFTTALGKLDPKSSLTTGYDFLADGSQAVSNSLASRITDGTKRKTLINETWAKSDELAALFPAAGSPDVASLNAHYDHYRSLPALGNSTQDESDLVTTADIASHPQTLSKRILFTMGCHAGLSMPAAYADDAAKGSDWAQNYLGSSQKAAVYLANTGFGYGDTAAVALSEQLMNEFAKRLDGSMSVGEAAVYAKQAYFGQLGAYGPYDEKAMQEATFYGFPMWKMATAPAAAPANAGLTPSADATGVLSAPVSVSPTFSPNTSKGGGTFFTATAPNVVSSGLQVTQYRPIVPKVSVDVTPNSVPAGTLAHGVFLTSLQSHDVAAVPAVARPTIDLTVNEPPPPAGDVAFPTSFNTLTQFNTPTGPRQQAVLLPGQFFRDASWANAGGVERLFDGIGAEVKYANSGDFTPPQLTNVNAVLAGGQLTISLDTADAAGTVKRVAVLVKDGSGQWTLHALTVDPSNPNHYSAVFAVTGTNFEYLAESQDSNGNVGFTTNKGRYFTGVPVPLAGATPKLVIDPGQPTGTNGWYVNGVSVSLQGKPGVAYTKSVDGGAATSYTGPFSVNTDGNHTVKATGNDGSSATLVVVIDKAAPSINAATDRAANANGWYNAPVTVSFACTDVTSGIRSCSPSTQVNTDGAAVATVGTALDFAGNTNSVTKTIKLDQVQPTVTVGGVANNAVYTVGSVPTPTCTVTDSLSGPAGCTTSVTGGAANGVGTYTYVAVGTDKAGNSRSVSVTYRVLYRWDGFQQPINDTGHEVNETTSVFKAGSNVPVKFQLKRADGSLVSANSTPLFMTPVQGGRTSLPLNESDYIAPPSAGGTFTLDGDHYQYNWKTDKAQAGYYWRIGVMLDDGTIQTVNIALR